MRALIHRYYYWQCKLCCHSSPNAISVTGWYPVYPIFSFQWFITVLINLGDALTCRTFLKRIQWSIDPLHTRHMWRLCLSHHFDLQYGYASLKMSTSLNNAQWHCPPLWRMQYYFNEISLQQFSLFCTDNMNKKVCPWCLYTDEVINSSMVTWEAASSFLLFKKLKYFVKMK